MLLVGPQGVGKSSLMKLLCSSKETSHKSPMIISSAGGAAGDSGSGNVGVGSSSAATMKSEGVLQHCFYLHHPEAPHTSNLDITLHAFEFQGNHLTYMLTNMYGFATMGKSGYLYAVSCVVCAY